MLKQTTVLLHDNEKIEMKNAQSPLSRLHDALMYVGTVPPNQQYKNTKQATNFLRKSYINVEVNHFSDNTNWVKFYASPNRLIAQIYESSHQISPTVKHYKTLREALSVFDDVPIFKIDIVHMHYSIHSVYNCGGNINLRPSRNSTKQCVRDEYERVEKKETPIGALQLRRNLHISKKPH